MKPWSEMSEREIYDTYGPQWCDPNDAHKLSRKDLHNAFYDETETTPQVGEGNVRRLLNEMFPGAAA